MTDLTYTKTYTPVTVFRFRPKDPGSALTHLIGFVAAIFATPDSCSHVRCFLYQISKFKCIYDQYDFIIWCQHYISFF